MIQDAPVASAYQCVQEVAQTATFLSLSGADEKIEAFLNVLKRYPAWSQAGAAGNGNNRLIVLRGPGEMPYRDMGALIFEAQRLNLTMVITSAAPLCRDKDQ